MNIEDENQRFLNSRAAVMQHAFCFQTNLHIRARELKDMNYGRVRSENGGLMRITL